jgi:RimJ/RimL family protein N-acetyltransferase
MTMHYPEHYGDGAYVLRRFPPDRVGEHYVAWMADPEVTRFLQARFRRWDAEALRGFVSGFDHHDNFLFGIHEAASGVQIGTLTLRCNPHHHYGVIGFMVGDKEHWGRSAATTAIIAGLDFGFYERRLRKITATTFDNHAVSNRIFGKLGFRMNGVVPDLLWSEGQYRGELHFSLDAGAWAASRGTALPPPPAPPVDAVGAR